jgi:hypothetical protein
MRIPISQIPSSLPPKGARKSLPPLLIWCRSTISLGIKLKFTSGKRELVVHALSAGSIPAATSTLSMAEELSHLLDNQAAGRQRSEQLALGSRYVQRCRPVHAIEYDHLAVVNGRDVRSRLSGRGLISRERAARGTGSELPLDAEAECSVRRLLARQNTTRRA